MNTRELVSQLGTRWAWIIYGSLALNGLPIFVTLAAGPRRWARRLALITLQIDLNLVWLGIGVGAAGMMSDAVLLPCLIPGIVLLGQLAMPRCLMGKRHHRVESNAPARLSLAFASQVLYCFAATLNEPAKPIPNQPT